LRAFHTTGITLALSDSARATAELAAQLARDAGATITFDINYRARLWSPQEALAGCQALLQLADLVFLPDRDAQTIFQVPAIDDPGYALEQLASRYPKATWVMTRGRSGSMAFARGKLHVQGIFASDEVGRLGGGDAFSAGFIARHLEGDGDVGEALRWGAATSALKYSIPGDLPLVSRAEVEALLASGAAETLRR
jgi:2-dehydro-3-deoxygluconokinase